MRTGRLTIGRGYPEAAADETPPQLSLVPGAAPAAPEAPAALAEPAPASDLGLANERLTALERLVRLYEQGALTPEEFTAEKLLILGDLPRVAPVHFVPAEPRRAKHGPSL